MSGTTLGFEFEIFGGNFRETEVLTSKRWHFVCHIFFLLRSLSARVGLNEIPRRFSSLPLFFASGRFATFLLQGSRPMQRGAPA